MVDSFKNEARDLIFIKESLNHCLTWSIQKRGFIQQQNIVLEQFYWQNLVKTDNTVYFFFYISLFIVLLYKINITN